MSIATELTRAQETLAVLRRALWIAQESDAIRPVHRQREYRLPARCGAGHVFTAENIYWYAGERRCLTCMKRRSTP